MTTNYLARKLMSTRLDKTAIRQFRSRKKRIACEKLKSVKCLHLQLSEQVVKSCRLCLRPGEKNIFSSRNMDLASDIHDILGIRITQNDGFSQYICNDCEKSLYAALQFKQTAEITQWRLKQEQEILNEVFEESEQAPRRQHGGYFKDAGEVIVREWYCKKCDTTFQSLEDFLSHEMQPSCRSSNKYICEVCGFVAKNMSTMKRHRLRHKDGPGEFKCSYCNYRSHEKYYITIHERWHTGEKPCKCQTCGKSFPNPSALYSHKKVHNPPKNHCPLCSRSFIHKRGLNDHIETQHKKEPKYPCDTCGKEFMTRKKKLHHERSVHKRPRLSHVVQPCLPPNQ